MEKQKKNITTIIQRVSDSFIGPLIPEKIKESIKPIDNEENEHKSPKKESEKK